MQFPRINSAINITLLYYNKHQIVNGVGILSGFFQPVKYIFNDTELPSWDKMVLNSHAQMEEEIKQIISLNYPYVQSMVFENLREVLSDVRIKSLRKEWITKIAEENNEAERLRLIQQPQGWSVSINMDFLPAYFDVVENAITNLKRIINKYLNLYDNNKLPQSYVLPPHIPNTITTVGKESSSKIKVGITVEQLTVLFKLMTDCKIIDAKPKDIHAFIADNFTTDTVDTISKGNVSKLWSSKEPDVLTFLIRKFTDMSNKAEKM